MKTLRVYISGTVQGQIFRKYLEEQAKIIGVRGFVRQTEDGKVELLIEGLDDKVFQMLELCKAGTQHVKIRDVQVSQIPHQGFEGFKILRI